MREPTLERDLLSYLLNNPNAIDRCQEELSPRYFLNAKDRLVYESILSLHDNEVGVTEALVSEKCKKRMPEVSWTAYVLGIKAEMNVVNVEYVAKQIRNTWMMKQYHDMSERLSQQLEREAESKNVTRLIEDELDRISLDVGNEKETGKMEDAVCAMMEQINVRAKTKGLIGHDTGFAELNKYTHGFQPKKLNVIAGRPGSGKSCLAVNLAYNMARKGTKVAFFSIEMPKEDISYRMTSLVSGIEMGRLMSGRIEEDKEIEMFSRATSHIAGLPIMIYERFHRPDDIVRQIRKLKRTKDIEVVFIDYIQRMTFENKRDKRIEVGDTCHRLQQMAKDLDICIVLLSQLNRNVEARNDKHPMMSDLSESGNIEQDSDVIMLLYNEHYYNKDAPENSEEVEIVKNRQGRVGSINLYWDKSIQRMGDLYDG